MYTVYSVPVPTVPPAVYFQQDSKVVSLHCMDGGLTLVVVWLHAEMQAQLSVSPYNGQP